MLQNYLKVALRNIVRHKFYSVLNILGLAFGLTACLLIGLYIMDELTVDKFHKDYENIYQVGTHINFAGQEIRMASSCPPLSQVMLSTIPGVEHATRVNPWPLKNVVMKYGEKAFTEAKAMYADSNFFEFFSFRLLEGNGKTVLKEPRSIVITPAVAMKYFGNEPSVGKMITVGNKNEAFTVTGVAEPPPGNSFFQYEMLLSFVSDEHMNRGGWGDNDGTYTYIRKNSKTQLSSVEAKLRNIVMQHVAPELERAFGITFKEFEKQGGIYSFYPYALADSYLYHPEIMDDFRLNSDIKYVYIMGAVGLFILLIACINFMNLSTARSASRAKEVGLRKTLGSVRSKLIIQFLTESFVYVFAATMIAIAAAYFLLPAFNLLSGKALLFNTILSPTILIAIIVIFVLVALLAGSYPAFYLTAFNPVDVLKGNVRAGMRSKGIRSSLVIVQFVISITLIICTMVVYHQLSYMQEKNLGLDKQNVLLLQNTERLATHQEAFVHALSKGEEIVSASYIDNVFPGLNRLGAFRSAGTTRDFLFATYNADYNHLDVLKIELLQGRYFSKDFPSDTLACVINEAAVRELGWSNPLGEELAPDGHSVPMKVIGVVKNFNIESFKTKVRPLVIQLQEKSNYMLVRYSDNPADAVASIEKLWKQHASNEPFEFTFLDQNFDALFREEQRLGELFTVMSVIAVFVACLGLLGLASFTAEQRAKEIGIRKVMGASVASVNTMLSKEFMMLVGISFVIASALAGYAMNEWLNTFAYRIELGLIVFLLAGLIAAAIAWLTVSYHFIKAARSNPAEVLRSE